MFHRPSLYPVEPPQHWRRPNKVALPKPRRDWILFDDGSRRRARSELDQGRSWAGMALDAYSGLSASIGCRPAKPRITPRAGLSGSSDMTGGTALTLKPSRRRCRRACHRARADRRLFTPRQRRADGTVRRAVSPNCGCRSRSADPAHERRLRILCDGRSRCSGEAHAASRSA